MAEWACGSVVALFVLVAADYRLPATITVGLVVASLLAPQLLRAAAVPLALLALFLPFWWTGANTFVIDAAGSVGASTLFAGRTGEGAATISNRTTIWAICLEAYAEANPIRQAIGYGYNGHIESGAAADLNVLTRNFVRENATLAHNSVIQTLLDGGWLLTGLLLVLLAWALRTSDPPTAGARAKVLASARLPLLAMALCASTEVTMAPGAGQEPFWLFLLLAGATLPRATAPTRLAGHDDAAKEDAPLEDRECPGEAQEATPGAVPADGDDRSLIVSPRSGRR